MFDKVVTERPPAGPVPDAAAVRGWIAALAALDRGVDDAERVEQIAVLEELKAAAAAAQARASVDLDVSTRAAHAAAGLPAELQGRGVAAQVALARRESPARGAQHLGLARALVTEMPHTLAALTAGRLSEWRATLLVRETACLTSAARAGVDAELCADPATLAGAGDRAVAARAQAAAYRRDPAAVTRRAAAAEAARRVTLRPAPDTMAYLSGLLPVTQGVAAYAALVRAADAARAAGDPRSRGQVMADTLVQRVTGQAVAADVAVCVDLVITDRALLAGDSEPAHIPCYGPVPAATARRWLRPAPATAGTDEQAGPGTDEQAAPDIAEPRGEPKAAGGEARQVWLRRLYTAPGTGEMVAMEARARLFPAGLRALLVLRDQTCRTPWCDAPIRHSDHALPHAAGGPTSAGNGQGLCEACNHVKQAPGWRVRPDPTSRPAAHAIQTRTPTGHTYTSRPPPVPGRPAPGRTWVRDLLDPHGLPGPIDIVFATHLRGEYAA